MPIYEYRCGKCGHCFEQIHGVSGKDPKIVCPRCGDPQTERVMSTFSCGGNKGIESGAPSGGCGSGGGRFS
ncbi:MAG: zinc ribbon domain-containing protein [Deltaproteobacteria bacterium]|nr:zinc ribbon domain-containing protein [Deltaproteobacteria bacterium]